MRGGQSVNPIEGQALDLTESGELATMMDEYEATSEEVHQERLNEHKEFEAAITGGVPAREILSGALDKFRDMSKLEFDDKMKALRFLSKKK